MSKRDVLITDLLLKLAIDENIPVDKRIEVALALQNEKIQREQNRHDLQMEKIKKKPVAQRSLIEQHVLDNEPSSEVEAEPIGQRVSNFLANLKEAGSEEKVVEGAAAHG